MRTSRRNDDSIRSFHRQLLSEYNPEFGLENYVQYFELKQTVSKIEKQIKKREELVSKRREEEKKIFTGNSPTNPSPDAFPADPPVSTPKTGNSRRESREPSRGGNLNVETSTPDKLTPMTKEMMNAAHIAVENIKKDTASTNDEIRKLEDQFFQLVQASFATVKDFASQMDQRSLLKLKILRSRTEDELRNSDSNIQEMEETYKSLYDAGVYRDLNVSAFSKILEKFLSRCCNSSLDLQKKVKEADKIISISTVGVPDYDTVAAMESVISIFSIVHKKTFEESQQHMNYAVSRDVNKRKRIIPVTSAVHFNRKFAHQQPHGSFPIKVLRGSTHPYIGKTIEKLLQITKTKSNASKFANGECNVRIDEAVRGDDVFIVSALASNSIKKISLSDCIMELMLMIQCTKLASARRITAVVPYMAYARQTASIAAIAEIMVLNGVNHVVTCDMQRDQVEGMFGNIPVENVTAKREFTRYLAGFLKEEGHNFENIVFVSPDSDGVGRAKAWADSFMKHSEYKTPETFVQVCTAVKRIAAGSSQLDVIGNVENKLCVIVDSVIDEGVNVAEVSKKLKSLGAKRIFAVATHAVFSGNARDTLLESDLDEIFVSDSVDQDHHLHDSKFAQKLRILPLGPLLAESIQRIHTENSLSTLFEK